VTEVRGLRASILLAQARSRFIAGRFADVEPLLRRALADAEQDDVPAVLLEILSVLAFVCTSATRLRHAREALDQASDLLAAHPGLVRPVVLDLAVARRAELEADWAAMGAAVGRALAAGPVYTDAGTAATVAFVQACHLIACGELAQAGGLLAHSPALRSPALGPLGVFRDCRRAEIEILLGRPHTALRLVSDHQRPPFALAAGVTTARAHLALGDLPQAQACISRILNTPSDFVDRRLTVEALVCGAQIADRATDEGRAVDCSTGPCGWPTVRSSCRSCRRPRGSQRCWTGIRRSQPADPPGRRVRRSSQPQPGPARRRCPPADRSGGGGAAADDDDHVDRRDRRRARRVRAHRQVAPGIDLPEVVGAPATAGGVPRSRARTPVGLLMPSG